MKKSFFCRVDQRVDEVSNCVDSTDNGADLGDKGGEGLGIFSMNNNHGRNIHEKIEARKLVAAI